MTKTAYLTIDDSPTHDTDRLTDFLVERGVPAVLFCIGGAYSDLDISCQGMEQLPGPVVRAIEKGFVVGNHTLTHRRASELPFDEIVTEIEKTEALIDTLYAHAGRTRTHKLLRFPHIDRGTGGWIVEGVASGPHAATLRELFGKGLNITIAPPSAELYEKKKQIQDYLTREGFTAPFAGINFPWYAETEMAQARDCLYTYSTSDWMLNPDFRERGYAWDYTSLEALKTKADSDPWLHAENSANIVLAHDHNNMYAVTTALIDHMLATGVTFQPLGP